MTITAAADGSALGNPGAAGWGWYIDASQWASGGWEHGTNNQGELVAVLDLLRQTQHRSEPLEVLCDSQYVINSLTKWLPGWKRKGWKKADGKPVLNVEIMQALDAELEGRDVRFRWVKGHAGHELNERADALAQSAARACAAKTAPATGPGFPGSRAAAGSGSRPQDAAKPGKHRPKAEAGPAAPAQLSSENPRTTGSLDSSALGPARAGGETAAQHDQPENLAASQHRQAEHALLAAHGAKSPQDGAASAGVADPAIAEVLALRANAACHIHPAFQSLHGGRPPHSGTPAHRDQQAWRPDPNTVFVCRKDGGFEVWLRATSGEWALATVVGRNAQ